MLDASQNFSTINPANGQILNTYNHQSLAEAEELLNQCHASFQKWSALSFSQRAEVLLKVADNLRINSEPLAKLIHEEMGKKIDEAKAEIEKSAKTCEYYAKNTEVMLKEELVEGSPYDEAKIHFSAQGVILSIMPWNFPVWQVIRFAAPSLMVGNTVLLKHSEITCGTGLFITDIFAQSFAEYSLVLPLLVDHGTAAKLIQHPKIRGVTFTGSSRGGREVAATAGGALKKTVLELGGSDAYVVLADADIAKAAKLCALGRNQNTGQSCVAAKRFIVEEAAFDNFLQAFKNEMEKFSAHPLAAKRFQKQLQDQVDHLKSLGAECVLGGSIPSGEGAHYPPSILVFSDAVERSEIHAEELFGPVALVYRVKNVDQAFVVANKAPYGLGGAVFSANATEAARLAAERMDTGFIAINDIVRSDPHIPFGGVKDSGYGRELGRYGLLEFVNIKTLGIRRA